jgi:hypothetical protein
MANSRSSPLEDDLLATRGMSGRELIEMCINRHPKLATQILQSQFVIDESLHFLSQGDIGSFLRTRASLITNEAKQVSGDEA